MASVSSAIGADYSWPVERVIDGDSFTVRMPGLPPELQPVEIRVRGVDTSELKAKCTAERLGALKAKAYSETALLGSSPTLRDIAWDKFGGRIDATVILGDHDLAELLVQAGLGRRYDGGKRQGWCP